MVRVKNSLYFYAGLYILFCLCFSAGCRTAGGAILSDYGDGATEYRGIQSEQRTGDAELAITGARIEHESRELRGEIGSIRSEIGEIRSGLRDLESTIIASQESERAIGDIIQQVRSREVDPAIAEKWRNPRVETGSGNAKIGDGEI